MEQEASIQKMREVAYQSYRQRQKCGCKTCIRYLNAKTDWQLAVNYYNLINNQQPNNQQPLNSDQNHQT